MLVALLIIAGAIAAGCGLLVLITKLVMDHQDRVWARNLSAGFDRQIKAAGFKVPGEKGGA